MDPRLEQRTARQRPGQMTLVMRAMSVSERAKVLRIGVVRDGRVVEERIIKQRSTITVGTSEAATFVIGAAVPAAFPLFERVGSDYHLNLLNGMKGRLALASGITELRGLTGTKLVLTEESRGKVVVGDTTFLFQFVAAPPFQQRPQLPLAVKGNFAGSHDWTLTFVAAFSFLLHFGLVGTMYSDWADPVVDDGQSVSGLVDMMSRIPPPPVVETPDRTVDGTAPVKVPTLPAKQPVATSHPSPTRAPAQDTPRSSSTVSSERSAKLVADAEAMQMQNLASLVGGPSVGRALERSNVPPVDLGRAAESSAGVVAGNGDFHPRAGGPVRANKSGDLSTLGGPLGAQAQNGPGKETATAGPTGIAQVGTSVTNVPVPGADGTVATLRARFRACYQAGLLSDPTMAGKVLVSARIGPNGEVTTSEIASINGLSPTVGQCIAGVVKRATFSAPGGGGATLQIPVTFVQQPVK